MADLPFALVKDSLPWRSEKPKNVKPIIVKATKTNDRRWSRVASTRDLPTIAFFRAGVLLRCSVPEMVQRAKKGDEHAKDYRPPSHSLCGKRCFGGACDKSAPVFRRPGFHCVSARPSLSVELDSLRQEFLKS